MTRKNSCAKEKLL